MRNEKRSLTDPGVRYGGYAVLHTLVVATAVIVLNVLANQLGWRIDMTDSSVYTLSRQTHDVIDRLDREVTIYLLATRNRDDARITEVLERYAAASRLIRVAEVDAEQDPAFAARFDPGGAGLRNGSVIVASADRSRAIERADLFSIDNRDPRAPQILGLNVEQRVTNALLFVAVGRTPIVYQTSGHGEIDLQRGGAFGRLGEQFRHANFELRTFNLAQTTRVPGDAAVVAVVRPRTDISEESAQKLVEFLRAGGTGFFAVDPAAGELSNLAGVLQRFGIAIPAAIVVEPDRNLNNGAPLELWPRLTDTSITAPLIEVDYRVLAPSARPVVVRAPRPRNVTIEPLLTTSPRSFYRTDLDRTALELTVGDVPGPHPIAVAATESDSITDEEITRIVVVGDVDFVSLVDRVNGNLDFVMNAFGWLGGQEHALSIRPKTTIQFPLQTTGAQKLVFGVLFVVVIPVGILAAAVVTWLRRRHL